MNSEKKRNFWPWVAIAGLFPIAALVLSLEGRLWICDCGTIRLWVGQICSSDNSQQLLDPYAFTHILHGFLLFWLVSKLLPRVGMAWQLWIAIALEAAWEIFENTNFIIQRYREETAALGYNGDTVVNSLGDIVCCLAGFLIARKLGWLRSLIVFAAMELILIVWIRDSLLLEILMLIYPIDSLKAWQMCR